MDLGGDIGKAVQGFPHLLQALATLAYDVLRVSRGESTLRSEDELVGAIVSREAE